MRYRISPANLMVIHPDGEIQRPGVRVVYDAANEAFGFFFPDAPAESPLAGLVFFIDQRDLRLAEDHGSEVDRIVIDDWRGA